MIIFTRFHVIKNLIFALYVTDLLFVSSISVDIMSFLQGKQHHYVM